MVAEGPVVVDHVVQHPVEILGGIGAHVIGTLGDTVDGLGGEVAVALVEAELRSEGGAEAQTLERRPHLPEVELGVEARGNIVAEVGDGGLADFVDDGRDGGVAARILNALPVGVIGESVGEDVAALGMQGRRDASGDAVAVVDTVLLVGEAARQGAAHLEPLDGIDVNVGTEGVAGIFLTDVGTLVVEVADGHVGVQLVGAAGGAQGMLLGHADAVGELGPVGGGHLGAVPVAGIVGEGVLVQGVELVEGHSPALEDVGPCRFVRTVGGEELAVVGEGRLVGARAYEFVASGDLRKISKELKLFPQYYTLNTILKLSMQMIEGIKVLHKYGIIHRDIKTTNMVIDIPSSDSNNGMNSGYETDLSNI